MKRISFTLFVILLCLLVGGCASRQEINDVFDAYEMETAEKIPYVYYHTFVFGDEVIDIDEILKDIDGTFHEVYVVQGDKVWLSFSENKTDESGCKKWNIASVNINGEGFEICYSGEFSAESGADKVYRQSNNSLKDGYQTDNGYYYDGKIVLTDRVKTVEYDLRTNESTEFIAEGYAHPSLAMEAGIIDYSTILFSKQNQQKVFDVDKGKQSSKAFEKLFEFEKEKTWQGKSYLSELFDKVQIINDQAYIICRVLNWDGETHAIVFQYDYDTNSCKYAFHCFMGDIIGSNLYIVPTI